MKIGIIGLGVVGSATHDGLLQIGNSMSYYDIAHKNTSMADVLDTDIVFVCVPTETINGQCDVTQIQKVVQQLNQADYVGIIAIKSTVLPGTTDTLINQYPKLKICFVPEFLRAKSALSDFISGHDVLVVGTCDTDIYNTVVSSHKRIPKTSVMISATEAEVTKYFSNLYNALRIVFANGMFEVCQQIGADYQNVLQAATSRNGILPDYLLCSEHYRGFGGHCLPKDTEAFESFVRTLGLTHLSLFSAIINDNRSFK
jgi:UDPglucose 6-dehydrogenase